MSRRILLSLREDWQAGRHEREGIWNILNCSPLKFVCSAPSYFSSSWKPSQHLRAAWLLVMISAWRDRHRPCCQCWPPSLLSCPPSESSAHTFWMGISSSWTPPWSWSFSPVFNATGISGSITVLLKLTQLDEYIWQVWRLISLATLFFFLWS